VTFRSQAAWDDAVVFAGEAGILSSANVRRNSSTTSERPILKGFRVPEVHVFRNQNLIYDPAANCN